MDNKLNYIKIEANKFKKEYKEILKKIEKYDTILGKKY